MCGLTFWFRAVVVLWFNFFDLLHLSFLLKSVSAMYNFRSADDQNLIKTNTRKVSVQKFEIWHEDFFTTFCLWTFLNSHWLFVYDKPDICWNIFFPIATVWKILTFSHLKIFFQSPRHQLSNERKKQHKMAKTTTNSDKLVRSLKVESIYNYIILDSLASINRWRH